MSYFLSRDSGRAGVIVYTGIPTGDPTSLLSTSNPMVAGGSVRVNGSQNKTKSHKSGKVMEVVIEIGGDKIEGEIRIHFIDCYKCIFWLLLR